MSTPDTPRSLFDQLKRARSDDPGWRRLHDLYDPIIRRLIRKMHAPTSDIDDLAQQILTEIVDIIPKFEPQRQGSFRCWLRLVCAHRVSAAWKNRSLEPRLDYKQSEIILNQLEDPNSLASRSFDESYKKILFRRLYKTVKAGLQKSTLKAFELYAIEGIPCDEVARALGISEEAVVQAKKRVVKKIRELAGHFLI